MGAHAEVREEAPSAPSRAAAHGASPGWPIFVAFAFSGVAGLVYEVLWSRYLGLYVGHGAYAQVLVLAVYLGGMAVGSVAVADLSRRLRRPLLWYAAAEGLLAVAGLGFHPLFTLLTELSYDRVFPALGSAGAVGAVRWGVAGLMILPQAVVLGTTFPLMAAGLVRTDAGRPGRGVARVYVLNTLGGAAGVLLAGFWLIGRFGLPGTSLVAAALNLAAAGLGWWAARGGAPVPAVEELRRARSVSGAPPPAGGWAERPRALGAVLLTVSFGTALASFTYEIGWIRMLSLVLGSATHAFELMLSAFILGLAVGAWLVRDATDRTDDPLRLLGIVQVLMGLAALASLPVYAASFDFVAMLVDELPGRPGGYAVFNVARYGLCLAVMLPSTMLAGMTLPLITGSLLRAGAGERAIGRVYGVNTIGSVAGAFLAGLVALPALGLERLLVAAAAVDAGLGVWLLARSARLAGGSWRPLAAALAASVVLFPAIAIGLELDRTVLTSGVYRNGRLDEDLERRMLYYGDGRTATVSAHLGVLDGLIVLSTNGKPDASLQPRWLVEGLDTLPPQPIADGRDFTTQVLAPLVALAHRPGARTVANIGHGSGMSATTLLASPGLERLVTIEIEPLMVEASLAFLPANAPAFNDPRSTYVFDDAKAYFSYRQERFDVIFAEPSNPWVSGTANLFTREFYGRVTDFLKEGGVLVQWIQLYELNDELFLTALAALDDVFPSYRGYLVGDADVAIVASMQELPPADWSVLDLPAVRTLTRGIPPFRPSHLESLLMFDDETFRAVLDRGVRPNSDYLPLLDAGAERARFERTNAEGAYSFASSRVDLASVLAGRVRAPAAYATPPARGLQPMRLSGRGAWLRGVLAAGGGVAPREYPEWQSAIVHLQSVLSTYPPGTSLAPWRTWCFGFDWAETALHLGTNGWADTTFYRAVYALLDRAEAPPEARAAVDLRYGLSTLEWPLAASAADRLVPRVAAGEAWLVTETLLDIAVLAYLETGRTAAARSAFEALAPRTGRRDGDLRNRLLDALISEAEAATD